MSRACATFTTLNAGIEEMQRKLLIATALPAAGKAVDHIQQFLDSEGLWVHAAGARGPMEIAMKEALSHGSPYPINAGEVMCHSLGWASGLTGLIRDAPSSLKLTLSPEAYSLLPELVPVPREDDEPAWLDRLFPIYRTLYHVDQRQVRRCQEMSLAIIYAETSPFVSLAAGIRDDLYKSSTVAMDLYPGSEFPSNPLQRAAKLQEVFFTHRAVLFLGHHERPRPNGRPGGWQLAPEVSLSIQELYSLLGGGRSHAKQSIPRRINQGVCIPEIVFASCCCGAWGEPSTVGRPDIFYPERFLDAGVRFFVGTWMDVVLRSAHVEEDSTIIRALVSTFFTRWADDPDHAVEHLYKAKEQCQFHLLTSLYQMYSRVESEQPLEIGHQEPVDALVSGLTTDDRLGDYVLCSEMWVDRYARTFWAKNATSASAHLVQVLVDEWQDNRELVSELAEVIQKLDADRFSEGHLMPNRHEFVSWSRQQEELRGLHILVYDRPPGESVDDWSSLVSRSFDRNQPDHFQHVLRLGAEIGQLLSELHRKQVLHGNLDPGSIVFLKKDGLEHPVIKDAWVKQTSSGRCTSPRYAAPEEPAEEEGPARLKYDCWGLGVILFELATGRPPFDAEQAINQGLRVSIRDAMASQRHLVPEALDRVVRECLTPSATVRPSADLVARRLLLALHAGGTYVSDLEQSLEYFIRAGQRLFAIQVDDMADLETVLASLHAHPRTVITYHLYEAAEQTGLIDWRSQEVVYPWISALELAPIFTPDRKPDDPLPDPDSVAAYNGAQILMWAANMDLPPRDEVPVLFIRGMDWWCAGPAETQIIAWRMMKFCQGSRHFPVIIIADSFIRLEENLARSFMVLHFPPLPPSDLFERILAAPHTESLNVPEIAAETAIEIAQQLHPCSSRELTMALRVCALRYHEINEHVVEIRDEERAHIFRHFGTVTYTPYAKLPQPESIGLPSDLKKTLEGWVQMTIAGVSLAEGREIARRVMISGASGYGKSYLAQTLAHCLRRPLVRIEASRCLQGGLGQSELALREALQTANFLGGTVVLLDDIDRFFGNVGVGNEAVAATMARMSAIFLEWLDTMPLTVVAVLTCTEPQELPAQWRRRIELPLSLDVPTPLDQPNNASITYRCAVFTALFRKFGLNDLARDTLLMEELARETHPAIRIHPLRSAVARRCSATALRNHSVRLHTGADIESWIVETMYLHGQMDSPEMAAFWHAAIR